MQSSGDVRSQILLCVLCFAYWIRVVLRLFRSAVEETFAAISELVNLDSLEGVVLGKGLFGDLVCEVGVDVADVSLGLELGLVGRRNLTSEQSIPVDRLEEDVTFHLFHSQTVVRVTLKQASEKRSSIGAKTGHNLDVLFRNLAQDLVT